jgi:hypothetical protein
LSVIKPGDYVLIQMGHNDQKEKGEGVGAFTSYKSDLKRFVADARQHGATPVLVTPMHRLTFDAEGKITNSLGDYPEAVRQAAKEENVALIDLNAMSKLFYEALGPGGRPHGFRRERHHASRQLRQLRTGQMHRGRYPPVVKGQAADPDPVPLRALGQCRPSTHRAHPDPVIVSSMLKTAQAALPPTRRPKQFTRMPGSVPEWATLRKGRLEAIGPLFQIAEMHRFGNARRIQ